MKKLGILLLAAAFAVCGLMTFAACNEETSGPGDDPIVTPGPDDPDDPGKPEEPDEPDVHTHNFGEWEVVTEPTCTEEGLRERVCACGEKESEEIAALGHTPGEAIKENEVAATCTESGSYDEVVCCTVCEEELSRKAVEVDALGHTPGEAVKENETAATCTAGGSYDEVVCCTVCEEELSRKTVEIDPLGHDYVNGVCSRCHDAIATEGLVFELLTTENSDGFEEFFGEDFEDFYACTGMTAAEENVVIPSTYNGLPVRMVHWPDLEPEISNRIDSLYFPDSVQVIYFSEALAFEDLTEIRLPRNPNVMILGSSYLSGCAFYNDSNNWDNGALYMDDWLLATNDDLPEEYTVKQGTVGIAAGAFAEVRGSYFESHVKKVTVPDGIQVLYGSFVGCISLEEVVLPDSLSSIGFGAFTGCESLESITIPDSVTSIGYQAFYECNSLTSIVIPDSVVYIGGAAFFECYSLTSIVIPDSVTFIGNQAFGFCRGLTDIVIPDGVTFIGDQTFMHCSSLTSITIPDSVTSIGDDAFFMYWDNLETVYYRGSEAEWNEIEIGSNNYYLTDSEIVFNYTGE